MGQEPLTNVVASKQCPFDTSRCKRHQAIYGDKWPYREKGVFTDLSSTTSDEQSSSSESSTPIRSTRLLKKRLAQKAVQFAASAASSLHANNSMRPRIPSRGRGDEVARRARRRAKSTKSETDGSSSPEPRPSPRKSRKQNESPQVISTQARKSISATMAKVKDKDAEPLSKKRKVIINAVVTHMASITAAAATLNRKKGDVGAPNGKQLARAARARARNLLKENPELNLDEIKVAAAAGVMRSGRARAPTTEKMPVTGPPITVTPKRKRAVISDDGSEEDTTHMVTRRGTRIRSGVSTKSKPYPPKSSSINESKAVTHASRKSRTSISSPSTNKAGVRTRSGSVWEFSDSSEDEVGIEEGVSPASSALRRPLLSLNPNPTFFAMRKRIAKPRSEDNSPLTSGADAPVSQARVKIIVSDLSSDGMDGQLSEDERPSLRTSTILHHPSPYTPDMKDLLSDVMDISHTEHSNALSAANAASLSQDELNGPVMATVVDLTVDKTEAELTLAMDGASSDLTQASAPSVTSSVPSSTSSTSVGTPQVPLPTETIVIRDSSPASTTSSPSHTSKRGNVRTHQTWKRTHVDVTFKVHPS